MNNQFADDEVIFGGLSDSADGACEFGIFVPLGGRNEAVWLPAITSDAKTTEQVKAMKLGQVFRITSSDNWGAMGTRIDGLEADEQKPLVNIPEQNAPFLAL